MVEFVSSNLAKEYDFYCRKLREINIRPSFTFISHQDILYAHFLICDYFIDMGKDIGGIGPRDINLLESAIYRQFTSYRGISKWHNDFERCATLFYGIIKNHPFHDANKRTAFLVAIYFLWKIGRVPSKKHKDFEKLTIRVADNTLNNYPHFKKYRKKSDPEILFVSDFFRRTTRKQDKRMYLLTFHQLNKKLKQYNCRLDNPSGNYIDVIKQEKKKKWFRSTYYDERKVLRIGFPGWTREVDKHTMHDVLQATGLTPQNGIDSACFFRDADSLPSLIPKYHGIFMRLKDK